MTPAYLKPGDKIAITCPAKKLPGPMTEAIALLESWGLVVVLGETVSASYHQFAGDDDLRTRDMQRFLNDDSIKAIIAARGGYGTIRIIDKLDFTHFKTYPKWIIGFSDITVLHAHIAANCGTESIHGQMPANVKAGSEVSLQSLKTCLFGGDVSYVIAPDENNRLGDAKGILTGGNLSLLIAIAGSVSEPDYGSKILFIEDVGEYLYAIDRMMYNLKRAGKLKNLAGLIVGGFTDVKDNDIPFGQTVKKIIMNAVEDYSYPVCFNFPAGHIPDNRALILGQLVNLSVTEKSTTLKYL